MANELAKAITRIICPALLPEGFFRGRRHVFNRTGNGIVQRLDFQLNSWGGRDFCVNISANLIASNEFVTLQPGFRLTGGRPGVEMWLPSRTQEQAQSSIETALEAIRAEALPFFEQTRSLEGFSARLAKEHWSSKHHLSFQRGVAAALLGDNRKAATLLGDAMCLYQEDGREWCARYIEKAKCLSEGLQTGTALAILAQWEDCNRSAHGI